ncbi:MAG: DUF3109 family protein [Candidatus Riflebacteria bacterium]|nr:DUF3109 family protein [Candidatus Riflebacteria bacterium]
MFERSKEAIVNLNQAKFKCHFPKCGGNCCKNGRPGLAKEEISIIENNLEKFKLLMRPEALKTLNQKGFLTKRIKGGRQTMAVSGSWCIFANEGCVLQKVGNEEGEKWKYKPFFCVLFPISRDGEGTDWYIRQKGYKGEEWDLYCLERTPTEKQPAINGLSDELDYLEKYLAINEKKAGKKHK